MSDSVDQFKEDVFRGLSASRKTLEPKYFYDDLGANLFEQICEMPEYYPTRTEKCILEENAEAIAASIGDNVAIVEYGSGALDKVRIILDRLVDPIGLIPVDISSTQLMRASKQLSDTFPEIEVLPCVGDFTQFLDLPIFSKSVKKYLVFFPGSTIGNFEPNAAADFFKTLHKTLGNGGLLLIGIDLQKDIEMMVSAYDDQNKITASFNKNILTRINREIGGNFDLTMFEHSVRYDLDLNRIEMHLRSLADQEVVIGNRQFKFTTGETIHTENSYKFLVEEFKTLAKKWNFSELQTWVDDDRYFAVMLLVAD